MKSILLCVNHPKTGSIFLHIIFFFSILFQVPGSGTNHLCSQEQSSALLEFRKNFSFNETVSSTWASTCTSRWGPDSYPTMSDWKEDTDCCSWRGVTCDSITGDVFDLNLRCSWLQGTIPSNGSFFRSMGHLQHLDLSYNGIQGQLPGRLFDLPRLEILVLEGNSLTGPLPEIINSSSIMHTLDISNTSITGELPESIGKLRMLHILDVSYCKLYGSIPRSLSNLTQILYLDLSFNNFTGVLPPSLTNLRNLTSLYLSNNNFHGTVPDIFSHCKGLGDVMLDSNNFSGPLPSSVANVTQLDTLVTLDLSYNSFEHSIPTWIFELPSLGYLSLNNNRFTGHINHFTSSSLRFLDLTSNYLHGPIPSTIENLSFLLLGSNNFTGALDPHMFCRAISLEIVNLSNNNLSGPIPQCLGNLSTGLYVINLQNNNFLGEIPDTFAAGNILRTIDLSCNQLKGKVPKSLVNCAELTVLNLGNNEIQDTFPQWLGKLSKLNVLILRSNRFHGNLLIPQKRNMFSKLQILDISGNLFTGSLPEAYLTQFQAMKNTTRNEATSGLQYKGYSTIYRFYYYFDSFTITMKGSSVELIKVLSILETVDLSGNRFEGPIPSSIGNLRTVRGLNLSHNNFTGNVPPSISNLSNLEWLDLSANKLTGRIPEQLTNLTFLAVVNLSQNHLSGPIPQGKQFDTFSNQSYSDNMGLCGPPLSAPCNKHSGKQQPPPAPDREENLESNSRLDWGVIMSGYGFGTVVGIVIGYLMLSSGRPQWLVRKLEGQQHGIGNRRINRIQRGRRTRN